MNDDRFSVVLADPPWTYRVHGRDEGSRTARSYYETLTPENLALFDGWLSPRTTPEAALFLWVTNTHLPDGLTLMGAWGYRFQTVAFVWCKTSTRMLGTPFLSEGREVINSHTHGARLPHFGMGHYTRSGAELCLLGTRGRMSAADHSQRQVILAPVRDHSQKPEEAYERIEALYPDRRRLEMFARATRKGWSSMGADLPEAAQEANP